MSAYALPGSFFLPSFTTELPPSGFQNEQRINNATDSYTPGKDVNEESGTWYSSRSDFFVTIKSASIDPKRLIQSFTNRKESNEVYCNESITLSSVEKKNSFRKKFATFRNSISSMSTLSHSEYSDEDCGFENPSNSPSSSNQKKVHLTFDDIVDSLSVPSTASSTLDDESSDKEDDEIDDSNYHDYQKGEKSININDQFINNEFSSNETPRLQKLPSSLSSGETPHEEAILFTLSINFNGRKYTATRALPTFIKLRNDLQEEVSNYTEFSGKTMKEEHTCGMSSENKMKCKETNPLFHEENLLSREIKNNNTDQTSIFIIPELPIGNRSNDGAMDSFGGGAFAMVGFAGLSFTRLHAMIKTYCSPMEAWLRSVSDLVPSSPSLANFLWEPIVQSDSSSSSDGSPIKLHPTSTKREKRSNSHVRSKSNRRGSVCTLDSINEDYFLED